MVGGVIVRSSKIFGLPMDLVLPSIIGILAISLVMGGDYFETEKLRDRNSSLPPVSGDEKFTYEEQELLSLDGWTDEGATSDQKLGALPVNVTTIRAILTWTDDIGTNDVLGLAIVLNGTDLVSNEASSGTIELEAGGNDNGTSDEMLSGDLTAKVTAVSCPGRVGPMPIDLDDGNSWTLRVYVTIRTKV